MHIARKATGEVWKNNELLEVMELNHELENVHDWLLANKLTLNIEKTDKP